MFFKKLFLDTFLQFCYRHMHFERSLYYFSKFSVDIVNLFGHDKRAVEIWYSRKEVPLRQGGAVANDVDVQVL